QMNTAGKGPELIRRELEQRGGKAPLIDMALEEYPEEKQFEKAMELCEKMAAKNRRDSKQVMKQKMEQLLLRKGFSYDMISSVTEKVCANMAGEDQDRKSVV